MKINWRRRLTNPSTEDKKHLSDESKEKSHKYRKYNRRKFDLNKYLNRLKLDNF